MPRSRRSCRTQNANARIFALRNKYRTFPIDSFKVLDGQSLEVDLDLGFQIKQKMIVRLSHIVAPKLHSKSAEERNFAQIAKAKLGELCDHAEHMEFVWNRQNSKIPSGVLIGSNHSIYNTNFETINDQMLNLGYVWCSSFKSFDLQYLREMQSYYV